MKMMAQTMISTDASLTVGARETIKAQREELKGRLDGQGYQTGQTVLVPNVGNAYRDLAEVMWQSNAYATRGQANEAALDAIIEGMKDRGDVDGLRALLTTEKIEGNKGTQLRYQFGNKINDAIVAAQGRQDSIISQGKKDIEAGMYEQLAGVNLILLMLLLSVTQLLRVLPSNLKRTVTTRVLVNFVLNGIT